MFPLTHRRFLSLMNCLILAYEYLHSSSNSNSSSRFAQSNSKQSQITIRMSSTVANAVLVACLVCTNACTKSQIRALVFHKTLSSRHTRWLGGRSSHIVFVVWVTLGLLGDLYQRILMSTPVTLSIRNVPSLVTAIAFSPCAIR
jgi:hypothetical protein